MEKEANPNVVYILADDMGYGDASCLNPESRIQTPNLDALARSGMTFTDAHSNSAVCTPTRYGVLTGRYCWRGRLQAGVLYGYSESLIEPGRMTVASFLWRNGYRTACVGKWHLGLGWQPRTAPVGAKWKEVEVDFRLPLTAGPHTVGFDSSYIIPASLDMDPYCYIEDGCVVELPTKRIERSERPAFWRGGLCAPTFRHETCLWELTQRAESFVDEQGQIADRKPFFLYFPLTSPHTPHAPRPEFRGKSRAGEYGDLMVETDWTVGRILEALRRNGFEDNTLVIFTSDNGCDTRLGKLFEEYGHRGNHIYRGQKSDAWDGGHRIPFFARWPGRIPEGSVCDRTICLTDLLATCAGILGARLPANAGEDSFDILPFLEGRVSAPQRPTVVHHSIEGCFAIREGKWKLIACRGSGGWSLREKDVPPDAPSVQLYDVDADPGEQRNLCAECPDVVRDLEELLASCRRNGRSVPLQS